MPSIGLVLSAGGDTARAFHSGALAALAAETGWDPRRADLIVGTSAGSSAAAYLRAGLSAADDYALVTGGPVSAAGEALIARARAAVVGSGSGATGGGTRPLNPTLAMRALARRASLVTGLAGMAPRGGASNVDLGARIHAVLGDHWPEAALWVCTVRVRDGKRVVFGRDDVPATDAGLAVRASCAVPRVYAPVAIAGELYIDGGTHSTTNADLVAGLAFDLVVVISSMSAIPSAAAFDPRKPGSWWFRRAVEREVAAIRQRGSEVLLIEPAPADLAARRAGDRAESAREAYRSTVARLQRPDVARARELLARSSIASAQ